MIGTNLEIAVLAVASVVWAYVVAIAVQLA
jgi:hypothetical protein